MHVTQLIKQKSYEHVVHVLHRHWFTFLPKVILLLVLGSVPFGIFLLINTLFPAVFQSELGYVIGVLFASLYLLSVLLFFYTDSVIFYLDMWVVTNDRIVDIEQIGLFSRTISELDLFRIQDVTTEVHGFFPTLFNYGTVKIKTASENLDIVFKDISRPNQIREELIQLSHVDRRYHMGGTNQVDDDE